MQKLVSRSRRRRNLIHIEEDRELGGKVRSRRRRGKPTKPNLLSLVLKLVPKIYLGVISLN